MIPVNYRALAKGKNCRDFNTWFLCLLFEIAKKFVLLLYSNLNQPVLPGYKR